MNQCHLRLLRSTLFLAIFTLPVIAPAQQTNTLETLRQTYQKQVQTLLDGYGKAIDSVIADLKKKGDLDTYLVVETEKKRYDAEKSVPFPADAKETFKPAAGAYFKARVDLMKRYIGTMDNLVKTEMKADRIDGAKEAKAEKEKTEVELATLNLNIPKSPGASAPSVQPVAETKDDGLCEIEVSSSVAVTVESLESGTARLSGGFTPVFSAVSTNLSGSKFIRVPWKSNPTYTLTVTKSGLLYQVMNAGDFHKKSHLKWQSADAEFSGEWLNEKSLTKVTKGQSFKCSGGELSFIAKTITLKDK